MVDTGDDNSGLRELAMAVEEETLMYFKTGQGQIRLSENMAGGILLTVDDEQDEQQAKASMSIETAKQFAKELNIIIERIEK